MPDPAVEDGAGDDPGHHPFARAVRLIATVLAALALIAVVPATMARAFGWESGPLLVAVVLTPFVALVAVLGLVAALVSRRRWLIGGLAVVVAVQLVWLAPLYVADGAPRGDARLTVATVNMHLGVADPATVVALARDRDVDLLSVQELAPWARTALSEAGLDALLPYNVIDAESGGNGTGLWSRTPLTSPVVDRSLSSPLITASVVTDLGRLTVVAAHPASPEIADHEGWTRDTARLTAILAAQTGPVVVAGDLNTTRDSAPFRAWEAMGYVDAADQAGAGFIPTFPLGRRVPPFVSIDHVLSRDLDAVATSYDVFPVPGSDHRMVVVQYG